MRLDSASVRGLRDILFRDRIDAEVKVLVYRLFLVGCDTGIREGDRRGRVIEHMLQHFEPSGPLKRIVGSGQNVVCEGFSEDMGAVVHVEVIRGERSAESTIRGRLVDMSALAVLLTGREEVIAHREAPVQNFVDVETDSVLGNVRESEHTWLAGLDLREYDLIAELDLLVHDVDEAKTEKVGYTETDGDADDEKHMVVILFPGEEVFADRGYDSFVLYGGGGVAAVFAVLGYPVKG